MTTPTLVFNRERQTLPVHVPMGGTQFWGFPSPWTQTMGLRQLPGFDGYGSPRNPDFAEANSIISLKINWVSIVIVFTEISIAACSILKLRIITQSQTANICCYKSRPEENFSDGFKVPVLISKPGSLPRFLPAALTFSLQSHKSEKE